MKGLVIKSPWIDYIFEGKKIWEIRGSKTNIRGDIVLIKSGSKLIYGNAEIIDCIPLTMEDLITNIDKHCVPIQRLAEISYKKTYAWIIKNPTLFESPIPYVHPHGAIIWVNVRKYLPNKLINKEPTF